MLALVVAASSVDLGRAWHICASVSTSTRWGLATESRAALELAAATLEAPRKSDREEDDPRLEGVGDEEERPRLPLPRRRRRRRSRLLRRRLRPFFFGSTYSASDSSGIDEAGASVSRPTRRASRRWCRRPARAESRSRTLHRPSSVSALARQARAISAAPARCSHVATGVRGFSLSACSRRKGPAAASPAPWPSPPGGFGGKSSPAASSPSNSRPSCDTSSITRSRSFLFSMAFIGLRCSTISSGSSSASGWAFMAFRRSTISSGSPSASGWAFFMASGPASRSTACAAQVSVTRAVSRMRQRSTFCTKSAAPERSISWAGRRQKCTALGAAKLAMAQSSTSRFSAASG